MDKQAIYIHSSRFSDAGLWCLIFHYLIRAFITISSHCFFSSPVASTAASPAPCILMSFISLLTEPAITHGILIDLISRYIPPISLYNVLLLSLKAKFPHVYLRWWAWYFIFMMISFPKLLSNFDDEHILITSFSRSWPETINFSHHFAGHAWLRATPALTPGFLFSF